MVTPKAATAQPSAKGKGERSYHLRFLAGSWRKMEVSIVWVDGRCFEFVDFDVWLSARDAVRPEPVLSIAPGRLRTPP